MNSFKTASAAKPYSYTPDIADASPGSSSGVSHERHENYPIHLAMGERSIFIFKPDGERQFLVFNEGFNAHSDPDCKNVIGSGFQPEHALHSAKINLSRAQLKPEDFQPRLKGCTFATAADQSSVLKHLVLDNDGVEIGRNEYRDAACKQALHRMLVGSSDITLEEFKAISVLVNIERGGKDSFGWLYADAQGQSAVRGLVHAGFVANSAFRAAAAACLESNLQTAALKPVRPTSRISQRVEQRNARRDVLPVSEKDRHESTLFTALLQKVNECLLSQPTNKDLVICPLTPEDGLWVGEIVAHTSNISPVTALRNAHEQFVASAARAALVDSAGTIEREEAPSPAM